MRVGQTIGEATAGKRIPGATYRLQFNRDFTFRQALDTAEYLHELGITDCYCSPVFKAGPRSTHGYDICRFDEIDPNLGGAEAFDSFAAKLKELGMGLVLDVVPNHMGTDSCNLWWMDVLEKGPNSEFASYFDIDWHPPHSHLRHKVLVPILDEPYGAVLESGQIKLIFEKGRFFVAHNEEEFPIARHSNADLLREVLDARSAKRSTESQKAIEILLQSYNGTPGVPRSFDKLDGLLQKQYYRLAYWRVGAEEINYRRFFDVNDLVALRMDRSEVFDACHQLIFKLIREGKVTGLRVDHPDGLWDPKTYLSGLQENSPAPLYVVVEKILSRDETLPRDWPVDGTTGYDFLNRLNGVFVNGASSQALDRSWREFSGCQADFGTAAYRGKKRVLTASFMGEVDGLAQRLKRIAENTRRGQNFTVRQLRRALVEIIACFPVYRTYATELTDHLSVQDRAGVEEATRDARARNPDIHEAVFDLIQGLLLLDRPADLAGGARMEAREFVMKFQQLTGPAAAKGVEDTAFYNYVRLASLNEVGGDPAELGNSVQRFHEHNLSRPENWPHSLLATATHDTKRGEDVRARINVLSETPGEWRAAVCRWRDWNAGRKTLVHGQPAPNANDEYLLYQTLIGTWPVQSDVDAGRKEDASRFEHFRERIATYMLKAVREGKVHTSWTDPDSAYEEATTTFVRRILDSTQSPQFFEDFLSFQRKVAYFGQFNSLAQVLLKIASPGVPDFYQGTEFWDFSLVDPDNRQPVDYGTRRQLLRNLKQRFHSIPPSPLLDELLREDGSGKSKLFLIWQALEFRNRHRQLFEGGKYVPVEAKGPKCEHVCAFVREFADRRAIVVVPRLPFTLCQGIERPPIGSELWRDTWLALPAGQHRGEWWNVFTGERSSRVLQEGTAGLMMDTVLSLWPVALLEFRVGT